MRGEVGKKTPEKEMDLIIKHDNFHIYKKILLIAREEKLMKPKSTNITLFQ